MSTNQKTTNTNVPAVDGWLDGLSQGTAAVSRDLMRADERAIGFLRTRTRADTRGLVRGGRLNVVTLLPCGVVDISDRGAVGSDVDHAEPRNAAEAQAARDSLVAERQDEQIARAQALLSSVGPLRRGHLRVVED